MKHVYHLDLNEKQVQGIKLALLPGDPDRVPKIADHFENPIKLAHKREYHTYKCSLGGKELLVTSTGMGGPSTATTIEELAQLGVRYFLRVGTTGAIQEYINVGDVIISTGAVRLDGASYHYAPREYPAVADYEIVHAGILACQNTKIPFHYGTTASSDTFYQGQERYDSYSKYVPRHFQGSFNEWKKLHVLNYEMEAATLFTAASSCGLKAGAINGVIVNRNKSEHISKSGLELGENNVMNAAKETVHLLLKII